ncbi:MAG: MotA/TolQ/ExbB proton channel family protein [Melioribacteraceae bacterium]|nr:MotA/TolQ/ExbB proton channel family protein [Melioribacteraceae bacterium]
MIKNYGTIVGLLIGITSIFGAFLIEGGSPQTLFLIAPLIIVFGGTFAAIIIGFGFEEFKKLIHLAEIAYFPKKYNYRRLIEDYFELSIKARKDGLLSLEKELKRLEYSFPQKLVRFIVDGSDEKTIENIALLEMKAMKDRHYSSSSIFSKMGGYAPTMGILGTVMALILTLANAGSDPNILIKNIATAFIATLWGVLSANLLWLPISDKLKKCHLEEKNMMEISLEGTLALQSGEIPSVLKTRLTSMLPQKEQVEILGI